MFGARFAREVVITRRTRQRMAQRQIDEARLLRLIDEGSVRHSDAAPLWAWLEVPGRGDNQLRAAVVIEDVVVVETVMHHWEPMP